MHGVIVVHSLRRLRIMCLRQRITDRRMPYEVMMQCIEYHTYADLSVCLALTKLLTYKVTNYITNSKQKAPKMLCH